VVIESQHEKKHWQAEVSINNGFFLFRKLDKKEEPFYLS
jgi:hypothetical protein